MAGYSFLLTVALGLSSPWWLWRMARTGRYREGLGERLGRVSAGLREAVAGRQVVWVHAVSVGEVLAAERMIAELRHALGDGWVVVVSTTTATGQKIARERLGRETVFYLPLDFAFAVRAYMRALRPRLLVLMENEMWPRLLVECGREGVPVAMANARVSDRSFYRAAWRHRMWRPMLGKVSLFLAQGEETAERLVRMGARAERVRVVGNLKHDGLAPGERAIVQGLREGLGGAKLVVAGSTLAGEEAMLLDAWAGSGAVLLLAPRHPERFAEVKELLRARGIGFVRASEGGWGELGAGAVVVLDTLGDLAAVYGLADVAFLGGSLVGMGGHNPLEAARFGVPVVMGGSYENFREIVEGMRAEDAIRIVDQAGLGEALRELLVDGRAMGERGRKLFERQSGATGRTVAALVGLMGVSR